MVDVAKLRVGDKVHYVKPHNKDEWENGIVKAINDGTDKCYNVCVVYHCAGDWDNYMDYTGAHTSPRDLELGWRQ